VPASAPLEASILPDVEQIIQAGLELVHHKV